MEGFDVSELDKLSQDMLKIVNDTMPKQSKTFMKKEGKKLTRCNKQAYQSKGINDQTGNLKSGFKTGKVYKFGGAWSVRAYNSSSHAHLLNNGYTWTPHKKVAKGQKKVQSGEEKWKPGFHFMEAAQKSFESGYYQDVEKFIDDVITEGL